MGDARAHMGVSEPIQHHSFRDADEAGNCCVQMMLRRYTRNQLTVFRATHRMRKAATTRTIPTELSIAVFTVPPH